MQISSLFVFAAIAMVGANAAALSATQRDLMNAPAGSTIDQPLFSRAILDIREATNSINSQAMAAQTSASSDLAQARTLMSKLNAKTVTAEQIKPVVNQIMSAITPASHTFTSLAAQGKNANTNSKRQGPDLNKAVDTLVVDLNTTLEQLTPLVSHLTKNLDLGTVQDLVIALTPTLTTLILGVEGLLTSLAPGLSTIVDPLLVTVYGLTDALGINLNLPAPSR